MAHTCLACGATLDRKLVTIPNMPARVQNMTSNKKQAARDVLTLDLYHCDACGLVQFDCEPVKYYRDVIRARGVSNKMHDLHLSQFNAFIDEFNLSGKKIWEVGCGRGEMLEIVRELPVTVYGTEHSRELIAEAREKGLEIEEGFIDSSDFISVNGPYDAFLSINFLEHQPHPTEMLEGIYTNLTENGVGLITVPSFDYFVEHGTYYELMRDHIANYDVASLSALVTRCGFTVHNVSRFNEDTISMVVVKRPRHAIELFSDNLEKSRTELEKQVNAFISNTHGHVVAWGASHQAFTLLSTIDMTDKEIRAIVDSADFKWGKASPGSGIEIISPETFEKDNSIAGVLILAPGYADEIAETIRAVRPDIKKIAAVHGGALEMRFND